MKIQRIRLDFTKDHILITSKIKSADDLFSLTTMGFRGEALPSICAISEVEVRTRPEGEQMGTRLVILGSRGTIQEPCVFDKGTVISVRKIFYNFRANPLPSLLLLLHRLSYKPGLPQSRCFQYQTLFLLNRFAVLKHSPKVFL